MSNQIGVGCLPLEDLESRKEKNVNYSSEDTNRQEDGMSEVERNPQKTVTICKICEELHKKGTPIEAFTEQMEREIYSTTNGNKNVPWKNEIITTESTTNTFETKDSSIQDIEHYIQRKEGNNMENNEQEHKSSKVKSKKIKTKEEIVDYDETNSDIIRKNSKPKERSSNKKETKKNKIDTENNDMTEKTEIKEEETSGSGDTESSSSSGEDDEDNYNGYGDNIATLKFGELFILTIQ